MKNNILRTGLLLCLLVSALSLYSQGLTPKGGFIGAGPEINGHTYSGFSAGAALLAGLELDDIFSAGLRLGYYHNFGIISSLEPMVFFRFNLPWFHFSNPDDAFFVQAETGLINYLEREYYNHLQVHHSLVGGISIGLRFNFLEYLYVEPALRFGYPHIWSFNVTTGFRFLNSGSNRQAAQSRRQTIESRTQAAVNMEQITESSGQITEIEEVNEVPVEIAAEVPGGATTGIPGGTTTGVPGGATTGVPGGTPGGTAPGVPGGTAPGVPGGTTATGVPGGATTGVPGGTTTGVPGGTTTGVPGGTTTGVPGGTTTGVPGGTTTGVPGGTPGGTAPGVPGGTTTGVPGGTTTGVPGGTTTGVPGGTTSGVPGGTTSGVPGGTTTGVPGGTTTGVPGGTTTGVPGGATTGVPGGTTTGVPTGTTAGVPTGIIIEEEPAHGIQLIQDYAENLRLQVTSIIFRADHADFIDLSEEIIQSNQAAIRRVAEILNIYSNYRIIIDGHANPTTAPDTQERLDEEDSLMHLSEQRALRIMEELAQLGVSYSRMTVRGFGTTRSLVPWDDYDNIHLNRRVEIILVRD